MITANTVSNLLADQNNVFAGVTYTTKVVTAAAHKKLDIKKHTQATVQLFTTHTAYETAVKNSATKIGSNDDSKVEKFKKSKASFEHDPSCYAIVHNANTENTMLYCRFIKTHSVEYTIDGQPATKQEVAEYLTKSAREKLLFPDPVVYNATHNIEHKVIMRTIGLSNIKSITCNKQTLTA